jgi:nucleoside-diphosphate-sugar epimerase
MKFIITGHMGLIGSHLKERLEKEGHECVMAIDKKDGKDLNDLAYIDNVSADIMFHFAAQCKINQAISNPIIQHRNNVDGTFNVLEFCRRNKIPKIVYASSSRILSKERNPYVAGKIYGEELCKAYHECYGIDYIIIRPSTVYGPCYDETSRAMHNFIVNAFRNEPIIIYGDNEKTLEFTYIDDFIDGVMLCMEKCNEEYNISGEENFIIDVAQWIRGMVKSDSRILFKPMEIAQPQQVKVDTTKIREIGFRPKVKIKEGIANTIRWYRDHPKAWDYYREARTYNGQVI